MFAPDWTKPCKSCSFWADGFNGVVGRKAGLYSMADVLDSGEA
jgi:predicted dithiol-disulfide oxidoreductase (DUF899 family)